MTAREIISNLVLALSERQKGNVARDEGAYIDEARTFWLADGGKDSEIVGWQEAGREMAAEVNRLRALLADGGKGKAVAYVFPVVGSGATDLQGNPGVTIDAPQADCAPRDSNESAYQRGYLDGMAKGKRDAQIDAAECAPREAQPVACTCKGVLGHSRSCALFDESMMLPKVAAPTPERADADTEGAAEYIGPHGRALLDAMASQEHADAGKDAALTDEQLDAIWYALPVIRIHNEADRAGMNAQVALRRAFARAILAANKEQK
jgi:hypothetical protein